MADAPRVLAIALEAAEPKLLDELMERGAMPELSRVAAGSRRLRVTPPAYIGSVPLWPSFSTGLAAEEHRRLYGPWLWEPAQMKLLAQQPKPLEPLWARSPVASIGLFDVPGAPAEADRDGFIVRGWGTHNPMDRIFSVWPPEAEELVGERHPFKCATEVNYKTGDRKRELDKLSVGARDGLRLRGDAVRRLLRRFKPELAIVNFPESHRTGHWLWHTLDSEHAGSVPVPLEEIYRELDAQLGVVLADVDADTDVFVFSLNGMEPADGIPDLLRPTLIDAGYSRLAPPRQRSLRARAVAGLKARAPGRLKAAYYAALPTDLTERLAELIPDYDWPATRAFAIPSEQHGWIRFNVAGREAAGIVEPDGYTALQDELEELLRSLRSKSGEPLVKNVVRTGRDDVLPDLVAHWAPAAFGEEPRLVPWLTGQHSTAGFCLAPEELEHDGDTVEPAELQRLFLSRRPSFAGQHRPA